MTYALDALRSVVEPALAAAAACVAVLVATPALPRLLRGMMTAHQERARGRWRTVIQAALEGTEAGRTSAWAQLQAATGRQRAVLADTLGERLRAEGGVAPARARELAVALGLTAEWREALARGSRDRRLAAAAMLGLVRDVESAGALLDMLDDPDEGVRAAAADALVRLDDLAALTSLVGRVEQLSRSQRAGLAESLRRIGPAVTASIVSLAVSGAAGRLAMADVLAMVGGTGARVTLLEWAADTEASVRAAVWRALGSTEVDERTAYHALRALGDPDAHVRALAARALGQSGRAEVVAYLAQHLDDEFEVAAQSAQALARLGPAGRAALEAREALGAEAPGLELARRFSWETQQRG